MFHTTLTCEYLHLLYMVHVGQDPHATLVLRATGACLAAVLVRSDRVVLVQQEGDKGLVVELLLTAHRVRGGRSQRGELEGYGIKAGQS